MNNLTTNLHLMLVSFYRPTAQRYKILIEAEAFPSDHYAVESQLRYHGYDPSEATIALRPRKGATTLRTEDIIRAVQDPTVALVLWPGVQYYTGQWFDIPAIVEAARQQGVTVGLDLAHAVGNVPLQLHDWNVDFAVWCSYKYLNAGPGNTGGLFVHERYAHDASLPRFAGWWGHDEEARFRMQPGFQPMPGADGWQLSNVNVLSLARSARRWPSPSGPECPRCAAKAYCSPGSWRNVYSNAACSTVGAPRHAPRPRSAGVPVVAHGGWG